MRVQEIICLTNSVDAFLFMSSSPHILCLENSFPTNFKLYFQFETRAVMKLFILRCELSFIWDKIVVHFLFHVTYTSNAVLLHGTLKPNDFDIENSTSV